MTISLWTTRGVKEIVDPHLEIRTRNGKFKVCLIAMNVKTGRLMWCDAGPASTRTAELVEKWRRYPIEKRSSFSDIEQAREYAKRLIEAAPLAETLELHSGLQEIDPPEFVETLDDRRSDNGVTDDLLDAKTSKLEEMIRAATTKDELEAFGAPEQGELDDLDLEGARTYRLQQVRERSDGNRLKVLQDKGHSCEACGFNFEQQYDGLAPSAHVHHKQPLALGERRATSTDEFAVLCAPCHTAVHMGTGRKLKPRTIEELRAILQFTWHSGAE